MKKTNKVLSVLLAAVLAFALSAVTAFAAPTSGSISVTGAKKDQTYTLYKLFDAKITFNADNTQRAIAYTTDKELGDGATWFEINDNGFVVAKSGVDTDWAKAPEAITWAKSFGTKVGDAKTASSDGAEIKWTGLTWGYYFVDSTLGSFISVTTDNADGVIAEKNELPTLAKVITAVDNGSNTNTDAIAEFGAAVSFKLTVGAKAGAQGYKVVDTLPTGLTAPAAADVKVTNGGTPLTAGTDYNVTVSDGKVTVEFTKAYLDTITAAKEIYIEYDAVVNNKATIGEPGNETSAVLTWGHGTDSNNNKTEAATAKVYTAQISIKKTDTESADLALAGFVIKRSSDNKYYTLADGIVTWVDSIDSADEHVSDDSGVVPDFTGLADGTYVLVEKTVPDGFNKLAEQSITIKTASENGSLTDANLKQSATVENKAGITLPETGALGTTIFYVVGLLAILGAGVFMVTNKRIAKEEI